MRFRKANSGFLLVIALALGVGACGGGGSSGGGDDDGDTSGDSSSPSTLSLRLTDAPGDLAHAWVDIISITLEGEDDNEQAINATLFAGSTGNIDLLTLDGTTTDVVLDVSVPAGSYRHMRAEFGNVVVETNDGLVAALPGSSHPGGAPIDIVMECSSCGLGNPNVKLPGISLDLDGDTMTLVLDFDASRSFGRWPGDPGRWFFRPAIYAVDEAAHGSIAGTVTLQAGVSLPASCGGQPITLNNFTILAYDKSDAARSGMTRLSGSYHIDYVVPGRYGMRFDTVVDFDTHELIFNAINPGASFPLQVVVQPGQTAVMDYLINQVNCVQRPPP